MLLADGGRLEAETTVKTRRLLVDGVGQEGAHAGNLGQTAQEYEPKGKAAAEIDALYSLILSITQSLKTGAKHGKTKLAAAT